MAVGQILLVRPSRPCRSAASPHPAVRSANFEGEQHLCYSTDGSSAANVPCSTGPSLVFFNVSPMRQQPRHCEDQQAEAPFGSSPSSSHPSWFHSSLCFPWELRRGTRTTSQRSGGIRVRSSDNNGSSDPSDADVSSCSPNGKSSSSTVTTGAADGASNWRKSSRPSRRDNSTFVGLLLRLLPLAFVTSLLVLRQSEAEGGLEKESPGNEGDKHENNKKPEINGLPPGDFRSPLQAPLSPAGFKPSPSRENLTNAASDLFDCVEQLAFTLQHSELSRVHLVACLLEMPGDTTVSDAIKAAGGDPEVLRKDMYDILIRRPYAETALAYGDAPPRPELRQLVIQAWRRAAKENRQLVGVQDLIAALLSCSRFTARMEKTGANVKTFERLVAEAYQSHKLPSAIPERIHRTPAWLNAFGVGLTDLARENKIGKALERDEELAEMQAILGRMTKPNCMLVGEPGVGKTALVEGLAYLIVNGQVSEALQGAEIYSLSLGALVSGSAMRGEFEKRIKAVIDYITLSNRNHILFVDEIHMLLGAGKADGPMDAANLLKPALARGQIRVIGATTLAEYRRHIEKDTAFARRFTVLEVKEPTEEKTLLTLKGLRESMQQHHNLSISDEALGAAVRLASRYIRDRHLPDKAIDLLDSACSLKTVKAAKRRALEPEPMETSTEEPSATKNTEMTDEQQAALKDLKETEAAVMQEAAKEDDNVVTAEDVAYVISNKTGIAVHSLTETDKQKILRLPSTLRSRVYGQDEAIQAVSSAVMRSRAGLAHGKTPVGTFLFLGPPGVGKTELAKALAMALYNDEKALIRLDMSEFSESHNASRLIGSPPGYMNHEEGGQLTEAVRARPYSVVLFDELENAHSSVFPYLLQLLDEGRLTDSRGITVDFSNCVIIATSNIGAERIIEAYEKAGGVEGGFRSEGEGKQGRSSTDGSSVAINSFLQRRKRNAKYKASIRKQIEEEAAKHFKPQVVNRMKIVLFDPLDSGKLRSILQMQEEELALSFKEQQIEFSMSDSARDLLLAEACGKSTGARNLRRYFEDFVAGPLSTLLLGGQVLPGMRVIVNTTSAHKKSLVAQTCKADFLGRCLPGSRRARLLSTIASQAA